jgi:hypothetical protein
VFYLQQILSKPTEIPKKHTLCKIIWDFKSKTYNLEFGKKKSITLQGLSISVIARLFEYLELVLDSFKTWKNSIRE